MPPTLDRAQLEAVELGTVNGTQLEKINGPAGTGKTTVIAEIYRRSETDTICLTPTNRAAVALRSRGVPAQTIHSAIYLPLSSSLRERCRALLEAAVAADDVAEQAKLAAEASDLKRRIDAAPQEDEHLDWELRDRDALASRRVIVDEASMVGEREIADIRRAGAESVLLVGDDAQLPPVGSEPVFQSLEAAVTLDSVHRQDAGSHILDIATALRAGDVPAALRAADDAGCLRDLAAAPARYHASSEIEICWRNEVRRERNEAHRSAAGMSGAWLHHGEWLISSRNRDGRRRERHPAVNGALCRVKAAPNEGYGNIRRGNGRTATWHEAPVIPLDCDGAQIALPVLPTDDGLRVDEGAGWSYAYCITCHRSQGGEWRSVTIYDDWAWADEDMARADYRRRWLYTAATRARAELIWCR